MKTLVLSASYMPMGVLPWERAFVLSYQGKAEVLEYYVETVRSAHRDHKVPAVIRITNMGKVADKNVRFNKRNIYLRDQGRCSYCLQPLSYRKATYDHVIPKSKGGKTNWTNIALACEDCNKRKADKTLLEAHMDLKQVPYRPAPISALKAFIQAHKSKAPKIWLNWLP